MNRRKRAYIDHVPRPAQEPVGYCWNATHYGQLAKTHMKSHGCIRKNCPFLERYSGTAGTYWEARANAGERRRGYQALRKQYLEGEISLKEYRARNAALQKKNGKGGRGACSRL